MITDLCAVANFNGYFTMLSPSWTKTTGYSLEELRSKPFLEFVHPEDREKTTREASKIAKGELNLVFENRYICKDGSIKTLHWRSNVDLEKKIIYAVARDITEQKIQEEKLNASNRKFMALLETITDGFMSINLEWRLTYANAKALKLWGKPEGLGKRIDETIPGFFESNLHKLVEEAMMHGKSIEFEERCGLKKSWFKGTIYPSKQGASLFMRDVSEQKAFERKMREQHEMLVQAAKLSSLGEMAGEIAHEINTPLAAIVLNMELISEVLNEKELDPGRIAQLLKSTTDTVDRISKTIKGLNSFARDAKLEPLNNYSVARIVDETLALCVPKFRTGALKIHCAKIDPELLIACRSIQISQVLLNLLNNAYDAVESLPDRWIRIEFADLGDTIELAVTDSGSGISAPMRTKIMEPFFTTKPAGKGTGLGLSISVGLIQGHGGNLTIDETSPNTRFVIRLPKVQPPDPR